MPAILKNEIVQQKISRLFANNPRLLCRMGKREKITSKGDKDGGNEKIENKKMGDEIVSSDS